VGKWPQLEAFNTEVKAWSLPAFRAATAVASTKKENYNSII
jgi:hypothetical protein